MVAPAVEGIDLFKIAGRSISGWVPSFKMGMVSPVRQPFCSLLEERLLMWLEYHPQVDSYARGDIGPAFATTYRLPLPKHAPLAIGYAFEGKPHDYLPDAVGTLRSGKLFIAEVGMEDGRRYPVLTVPALKNDAKEAALGNFLLTALGLSARGRLPRAQIPLIRVAASIWRGVPGHRRCS